MDFKHKKKYGQNFLTNANEILKKIIDVSAINKEETILEIGPGEGALTALMLDEAKEVICIEIDKDLEKILNKKFSKKENFKLIMQDILQFDFKKELNKKIKVVANIPYYITSPIIQKLFENKEYIDEIYIMVQKEVGERICAKQGKERSVLTLSIEYFAEAEYCFTIPKEDFTPMPKIDSGFIAIKLRKDKKYENEIAENIFFKYIKAAFSNKRKNILNNFCTLGYSKDYLREVFQKYDIDVNLRAENISIDKFVEIIKHFEENK